MLSAGLALGACAMPDTDSFRAPNAASFVPPEVGDELQGQGAAAGGGRRSGRRQRKLRRGLCAAAASGDQSVQANVPLREAGIPLIPAAIALEMTECDVVKRAGVAERVEIGTNDRRERTATLTYISGQRPGIYNFVDGRLKSMELGPEPPARAEAREEAGQAHQARGPAEPGHGSITRASGPSRPAR